MSKHHKDEDTKLDGKSLAAGEKEDPKVAEHGHVVAGANYEPPAQPVKKVEDRNLADEARARADHNIRSRQDVKNPQH